MEYGVQLVLPLDYGDEGETNKLLAYEANNEMVVVAMLEALYPNITAPKRRSSLQHMLALVKLGCRCPECREGGCC